MSSRSAAGRLASPAVGTRRTTYFQHGVLQLRPTIHRSSIVRTRAAASESGAAAASDGGFSGSRIPAAAPAAGTRGATGALPGPRLQRPSLWKSWLTQLAQLLQYRLMMLFRWPTWGKVLALIAVGLPIIIAGSLMLTAVTDLAWTDAAQYAFYVLQNVPGMDITGFTELPARVVLVAIHLLSLYTFATLVGLLTEDVRTTVEEIRCGNFPIPTRNHTVILDPGEDPSRLVSTLKQVLGARAVRGGEAYPGCVAVLSGHDKDELDRMIADVLPEQAGQVVTRHGSPIKVADLERVAAARAHTVLLLAPAGPMGYLSPGLQQQLCLTALRALNSHTAADSPGSWSKAAEAEAKGGGGKRSAKCGGGWRQRVVVESNTSAPVAGADVLGEDEKEGRREEEEEEEGHGDPLQVTYVSSTSSASRVAVQCAVQPGLSAVFDTVFCRSDGTSLRLVPVEGRLAGHTFAELRRQFDRATPCGVLQQPRSAPTATTTTTTTTTAAVAPTTSGSEAAAAGTGNNSDTSSSGGGLRMCPPDDLVLLPGDRLVVLAREQRDCRPLEKPRPAPPLPALSTRYDGRRSMSTHIVLLVANSQLPRPLTAALGEFVAPGCRVTVVSPEPCSGLSEPPSSPSPSPSPSSSADSLAGLRVVNEVGELLAPPTLIRADVTGADAVILTGTDDLPRSEADALAVGAALLLQRLLADPWVAAASAASASAAEQDGRVSLLRSLLPHGPSKPDVVQSLLQTPGSAASVAAEGDEEFWTKTGSPGLSSLDVEPKAGPLQRGDSGAPKRRPTKPLTYVCSLHDTQNRPVLQHIAKSACRTAAAAIGGIPIAAAAAAAAGGKGGGGGGGGGAEAGGSVRLRGLSLEVVEPEALISGILAQVGADPLVVTALEDLLDDQGYELYIKRYDRYGIPSQAVTSWAQVAEVVRAGGEVALGYVTRGGHLHLAPPADTQLAHEPGSKLVVLSESFL